MSATKMARGRKVDGMSRSIWGRKRKRLRGRRFIRAHMKPALRLVFPLSAKSKLVVNSTGLRGYQSWRILVTIPFVPRENHPSMGRSESGAVPAGEKWFDRKLRGSQQHLSRGKRGKGAPRKWSITT